MPRNTQDRRTQAGSGRRGYSSPSRQTASLDRRPVIDLGISFIRPNVDTGPYGTTAVYREADENRDARTDKALEEPESHGPDLLKCVAEPSQCKDLASWYKIEEWYHRRDIEPFKDFLSTLHAGFRQLEVLVPKHAPYIVAHLIHVLSHMPQSQKDAFARQVPSDCEGWTMYNSFRDLANGIQNANPPSETIRDLLSFCRNALKYVKRQMTVFRKIRYWTADHPREVRVFKLSMEQLNRGQQLGVRDTKLQLLTRHQTALSEQERELVFLLRRVSHAEDMIQTLCRQLRLSV